MAWFIVKTVNWRGAHTERLWETFAPGSSILYFLEMIDALEGSFTINKIEIEPLYPGDSRLPADFPPRKPIKYMVDVFTTDDGGFFHTLSGIREFTPTSDIPREQDAEAFRHFQREAWEAYKKRVQWFMSSGRDIFQ